MSSSKRHNKKKRSQQSRISETVPLYIKRGIARTKEIQSTVQSLCGDSSSSDEKLPALRLGPLNTYKVDLTKKAKQAVKCSTPRESQSNKGLRLREDISITVSDDNSVDDKGKKMRKSVSSKDSMAKKSQKRKVDLSSDSKSSESDCNKQKALSKTNAKGKKTVNNRRKERNESEDSEDSDSDLEIYNKSKGKRRSKLKSIKQVLAREEGESSSGKEFQKSKLSRHSSIVLKKSCENRGNHSKSTKSQLASTKHSEENTGISEEQSLNFKSGVIKILNRFKDVCSEYELHMEHVKCKHVKKKLSYQESARNAINKSKDVIVRLRAELDTQEKELTDFYKEWHKNCNSQNTSDEDSSLSEGEVGQTTRDTSKRKSFSEKENVVSDCESKKIFSENESSDTNVEESKKDEDPTLDETEKIVEDDNNEDDPSEEDDVVASPILGKDKKKEASDEVQSKGKSGKIDTKERDSTESQRDENEHDKSDSSEDMFDSTFAEKIKATDTSKASNDELEEENNLASKKDKEVINESESANSDSNTEENLVKNGKEDELNVEPDNEDSNMDRGKSVTPEPVISPEVESMSDTESSVTTRMKRTDDNCSDTLNEEEKAKKALLDSDSDTPANEESLSEKSNKEFITDNPPNKCASNLKPVKCNGKKEEDKEKTDSTCEGRLLKKQDEATKAEVRVKRSLRKSNSNGSATHSATKCDTSDEKHESDNHSEDVRAKAKLLASSNSESSSSEKDKKDSSNDDTVSDVGVSEKVKKRRIDLKKICDSQSDEKLRRDCHVPVERLPEEDLKKYANALRKSREYLEDKKIKSLIDLDSLAKCRSRANDSTPSSTPKRKTKAAKEEEDTLLNHLKKVENGEFDENLERDSGSENSNAIAEPQIKISTNEELMMEADRIAKKMLLNSDSDIGEQKAGSESSNSESEKSDVKDDTKKSVPKQEKKKNASASDKAKKDKDDDEREKSSWRRNKLLTMKFSSESDSDVQRKKWNEKNKKLQEEADGSGKENSDANDTSAKRKRRTRRKILDSDSDIEMLNSDSDSDKSVIMKKEEEDSSDSAVGKKKRRKRKPRKSSDTDSSLTEKRPKSKRRRIKNIDTDSDESADNDQITNSQGTPGKKGRKNIRRVIKDKQVADDTKQAAKEEEERIQRIAERQKLYNEMYEARLAGEEKVEKLVLDFNSETKEELISVHPDLVKRLKPHQAKGIKFMWDACFESLEMMKTSSGSGCIIAHCMGLGKTLQVIALTHTLLRHEETGVKKIMIVSPLSTVLNWVNEFHMWLNDVEDGEIEVYELTKFKKNVERKYQLERWQNTGGVLIIGYEMFRTLSGTNNKMRKNMKEAIFQYLIDPGPDMIVCDEGHLLKNEDTALSKSMTRIKTLRRIILTGTPLQNNLTEYHCMVQFIKPSLLGTKKEFLNRFVNPITNGQFDDSTESDVKLMKKRAYVLHKMLKGCVQRFDYSVLTPFLPPKQEYVIFVRLTEVQINMYRHYLDNFARRQRAASGALFADYQALQRIWTHPLVLRLKAENMARINEMKSSSSDDSEGSLRDFIHDSDTQSTSNGNSSSASNSSDDDDVKSVESVSKKTTKGNDNADVEVLPKPEENEKKEDEEWWLQFTQPEHFKDLRMSAKLMLLFGILKECEQIGDKVLIFSQSLYSLTLIEKFLETIDDETRHGENSEFVDGYTGSWTLGLDYFRLDGKTTADNRNKYCKIFNRPTNTRARLFLISTRAGGLGINLTAANRVIIFDASWNPSHDVQSIFRIYRFGQKKPCYIYRFLAAGTMEEKIYNRQVTKLSLSCRVIDEQQIGRHYSNHDLNELYNFDLYTNASGERSTLNLPKDRLLAEIFLKYKESVENYHEHDSLLENKAEEELDEEERKQAWAEYEEEKKGKPMMAAYPTMYPPVSSNLIRNQYNLPIPLNISTDYEKLQQLIRKDYPNATPEAQQIMTTRVLSDMYSYWEQQTYHNTANQLSTQNAGIIQPTTGVQVTNLARMLQVPQNTNVASGQARNNELPHNYMNITKSKDRDDDIVEIPPPAVANKSKAQEE